MSNTVNLVKAASERKFLEFEDMAKASLKEKLIASPKLQDFVARGRVAMGMTEGENPFAKKDDDKSEKDDDKSEKDDDKSEKSEKDDDDKSKDKDDD